MDNEKYMKRCYGLAVSAGKKGFDTFGALLVHDGEILEEAENTADWKKGIFGHAEFNLVHKCANRYPDNVLKESVLYTSCAPCERCLCAIACRPGRAAREAWRPDETGRACPGG